MSSADNGKKEVSVTRDEEMMLDITRMLVREAAGLAERKMTNFQLNATTLIDSANGTTIEIDITATIHNEVVPF